MNYSILIYLYLLLVLGLLFTGLAHFVFAFFLALSVIYIFQIKEYRLDRVMSQIREDGFLGLVKKNFGKRPALSQRNILIAIIALVYCILLYQVSLTLIAELLKKCPDEGKRVGNAIVVCQQNLGFRLIPPLKDVILATFFTLAMCLIVGPLIAVASTLFGILLTEPMAIIKRSRLIARAKKKVEISEAVFIGISGTYGKTTTKEFLHHILSQKFRVGKTDENMNTDVGVAVSILRNLNPDTEYFVAEVGAYKLGEVRRAAAIFSPRAAIMLPFGNQHIDLFGSKENLVAAESEILEFIPEDGVVYVNADIPELEYVLSHTRGVKKTYSITKKADIYATDITSSEKGSGARVHYDDKSFKISTKLLGKHVIQNLLPAIAAAIDFGMTTQDVAAAIATLNFVPGKLSVHEKNGAVILNDTGNSSLHGFLAAIDTIKLFNRPNMFILSKGIIELGKEKNKSYKKLIMQIEQDNIGLATTDKLFKQFDSKNNVTIIRTEDDLYRYIVSKLDGKTAVLLEGKFTKNFVSKFA